MQTWWHNPSRKAHEHKGCFQGSASKNEACLFHISRLIFGFRLSWRGMACRRSVKRHAALIENRTDTRETARSGRFGRAKQVITHQL
jgi:hypothetical protein